MKEKSKFAQTLIQGIHTLKNTLFPRGIKCIVCGQELKEKTQYGMCGTCLQALPFHSGKICYRCGDSIVGTGSYCLSCKDSQKDYEFARAPFLYEGAIQTLIYKLKYAKSKYLAPFLSAFLVDEFVKQDWQIDLVVPVPLHSKREKERGFNQAELLCCLFNEKLHIPIITNNLVRVKHTRTQTKLTKKQRKDNLEKAFQVLQKSEFKNKNILLIDDVFTTGATIEECSEVLKKAGAKNVYAITLAHVNHQIPLY